MYKLTKLCFITLSGLFLSVSGLSADSADMCSEQMLRAYFPASFVTKTLEKFQVPKDQMTAIIAELTLKDKDVIPTFEKRATEKNPNLLRDPKYREEGAKLFRSILTETFSEVLKNHGITDADKVSQMLDDIQEQKAEQFSKCMPQNES